MNWILKLFAPELETTFTRLEKAQQELNTFGDRFDQQTREHENNMAKLLEDSRKKVEKQFLENLYTIRSDFDKEIHRLEELITQLSAKKGKK